ncbi:transcriptional repressor TCF25-domain-containing protein [Tribonema minus]|uniref:Transcriptional repressor TCF25-domain-containing protein n=1 Tax=Tribonema minus TaxID=303371 RepID=A0A835ZGE8_9STRA|nr:transcriptional repressor TCF25-domain-containing protein [Tribonema minus]
MSARQQARLRQARGLELMEPVPSPERSEAEESEEEDEQAMQRASKPATFAALVDSSSDGDSDESEENTDGSGSDGGDELAARTKRLPSDPRGLEAAAVPKPSLSFCSSHGGAAADDDDDDALLDGLISQLSGAAINGGAAAAAAGGGGGDASALDALLACDPRALSVDAEMRRKFGAGAAAAAADADAAAAAAAEQRGGAGGGARRRRGRAAAPARGGAAAALGNRRLLLGPPKEDWSRPPSLVGGGLGMERAAPPAWLPRRQRAAHGGGAQWFAYRWSEEYARAQQRFEAAQATADPNNVALLLWQAPHHADALLQLGMVYAHTGQMDHASEFVRRCLYVLECAVLEPCKLASGRVRMDVTHPPNATLFGALFRHAQQCSMMGCRRTAMEVSHLLLSLDPIGDPMGALLCVDCHALACKEGRFVLSLAASGLPIGFSPALLEMDWAARGGSGGGGGGGALDPSDASPDTSTAGGSDVSDGAPLVTVADLPGLALSAALAHLDAGDAAAARAAARRALRRFPAALEPLLAAAGAPHARTQAHPVDWKSVFRSAHFGGAAARLAAAGGGGGVAHPLAHLCAIYAARAGELWRRDDTQELLYDGAGLALQGAGGGGSGGGGGGGGGGVGQGDAGADDACCEEEREVLARAYRLKDSPLLKYLALSPADFSDAAAYQQLPHDVNILNPALAAPQMLPPGRRLRGAGAALDAQLRQHGAMRAFAAGGAGGGGGGGGTLDPSAPLAELLWRSLLPWNTMETPRNPPPRGAPL